MSHPTTFMERFIGALTRMCGATPPEALCQAWLDKTSDELQNWVGAQPGVPRWAQCIVTIDAATIWADEPEEGAGHAYRD